MNHIAENVTSQQVKELIKKSSTLELAARGLGEALADLATEQNGTVNLETVHQARARLFEATKWIEENTKALSEALSTVQEDEELFPKVG